jgi:hypothetical protein
MNISKVLLFLGLLLVGGIFNIHSQTSPIDKNLIGAGSDEPTTTKLDNYKGNSSNPFVTEGKYSDATNLSYHEKLLVIYISGAKGSKLKPETYTAQQYAEILQKAFANPKYTDKPVNIMVVFNNTEEIGSTTAHVLINGEKWKTKDGRSIFAPGLIAKHIDMFADAYADINRIVTYSKPDGSDIVLTEK